MVNSWLEEREREREETGVAQGFAEQRSVGVNQGGTGERWAGYLGGLLLLDPATTNQKGEVRGALKGSWGLVMRPS